jgi:acetyl esterase/lipase
MPPIGASEPIALWPGAAPGSEDWAHTEVSEVDPELGHLILKQVVVPTVTPVLPEPEARNGTAVVIAPGGGFVGLAWEHEGVRTAEWFADLGVAAFVLKYRVAPPRTAEEETEQTANLPDPRQTAAYLAYLRSLVTPTAALGVSDGEQAVRVVRSRAGEWGVDPGRIGLLGFSAGGTVALGTGATLDPDARPAFVASIYGAFLERDVPAEAPPCFVTVALDDPISTWCLEGAEAWRAAQRPLELHVYERGGHGFGLRPQGLPIDSWMDRLADWLGSRQLL